MTTDSAAFLAALRLGDSFLPVGGYTASYGLEQYVNEGRVETAADLRELLEAYLRRVVGPCETVALANAHDASAAGDLESLLAVDERLHAVTMPQEFRESSTKAGAKLAELLLEADADGNDRGADAAVVDGGRLEGDGADGGQFEGDGADGGQLERSGTAGAFAAAIAADETPGHYPVAFGVVAQSRGISRLEACLAHAHAFVTGLLGAAQRLGRFGHTEIQGVLEDLRPVLVEVCERHVDDDPTAMAAFAPFAEIMGMRHERAGRRLFVS